MILVSLLFSDAISEIQSMHLLLHWQGGGLCMQRRSHCRPFCSAAYMDWCPPVRTLDAPNFFWIFEYLNLYLYFDLWTFFCICNWFVFVFLHWASVWFSDALDSPIFSILLPKEVLEASPITSHSPNSQQPLKLHWLPKLHWWVHLSPIFALFHPRFTIMGHLMVHKLKGSSLLEIRSYEHIGRHSCTQSPIDHEQG